MVNILHSKILWVRRFKSYDSEVADKEHEKKFEDVKLPSLLDEDDL